MDDKRALKKETITDNGLRLIPFNIDIAKRIQNGNIDGKIVTRDNRLVRIICWDAKRDANIIALVKEKDNTETLMSYPSDGLIFLIGESPIDLFLKIPITFETEIYYDYY